MCRPHHTITFLNERAYYNAIIRRREVNPKARVKGGETMNFETVFERKQKQSKK